MAGMPIIQSGEAESRPGRAPRGKFMLLAEEEAPAMRPPALAAETSIDAVPRGKFALLAEDSEPPSTQASLPARIDAAIMPAADKIGRQVGLTLRAGARSVAALPGMVANVPAAGYNALADLYGWATGAPRGYRFPDQTQAADVLADKLGLPAPANASERVAGDVASAMGGSGAVVRLGNFLTRSAQPVVSRVGQVFSAGPGTQVAATGAGAGAAGVTREAGGGPGVQLAAGLGTAAAVSAGPAAAAETLRRFVRGGDTGRRAMESTVRTFDDAGTTPSLGQATGNRAIQATESAVSKTPGGAGVMARAAARESEEMGRRVEQLAQGIMPNASAAKAGARIEKGIGSFVDQFKAEQNFLYEKLDRHIAKDRPIDMTNTANALSALNADIPGAPALSKFFKNETVLAIEGAMKSDTKDFTTRLPYEALKKLRTLVGAEIENTTLASSVPRSKWKTLYAAISDDLGQAAREASPDAQRAFNRANAFTRAGHERIDTFLDRVAGKDTVEKMFQAAVNPSEIREGASTLNAVMRSIPKDDRKMVSAAVVRRMGVANPGAQDETGAVFSAQTFLTNWSKMSPEAKLTLFGGTHSPTLMRDLEQVAKAASVVREGSKVFSNPSGTTQAAANVGGGVALALSVGHGNFGAAGLILGGMALANISARMLTNPAMVTWFARATKAPTTALPTMLNELAQLGARSKDPALREDVANYVRAAGAPRSEAAR